MEFEEYENYKEYEDYEGDMHSDEFDVFDKKVVHGCEISAWEWVCEECNCVNLERKKPRWNTVVSCLDCGMQYNIICEE